MTLEVFMAVIGFLLLMCVFANRISSHFGIPSLLIFLAIGMLAGSDGVGIPFYSARITNFIGSGALAFILFSGGLETRWKSIRPVVCRGVLLSTFGVFFTALFLFLFAFYILRLEFQIAMLLSVIVSSTDAPAVFNILRSNNLYLNNDKLKSILEFESGSNDPMAVILSVGAITMLSTNTVNCFGMLKIFGMQMGLGFLCGLIFGRLTLIVLRKFSFVYQGLYPVFGVSVVCLCFSLTQLISGNGFLAIYICGIILGNASYPYRNPFIQFQDALAWMFQILMFLTLGLLVNPLELRNVFWVSLGASVCLMFFARPLAVFICLVRSEYTRSDKLFISWAGLKGAVPIILATYPLMSDIPHAEYLFNVIFFLVIISVFFQGRTLAPLARFLNLSHDEPSEKDLIAAGNVPGLPTGQQSEDDEEDDDYKTIWEYVLMAVDSFRSWAVHICFDMPDNKDVFWLKRRLIVLRRRFLIKVVKVRSYCRDKEAASKVCEIRKEFGKETEQEEKLGDLKLAEEDGD